MPVVIRPRPPAPRTPARWCGPRALPSVGPRILAVIAAAVLVVTGLTAVPTASAARTHDWDFEATPVGSLPTDCRTVKGAAPAAVTDGSAARGERSLRLADPDAGRASGIRCLTRSTAGADLRFAVDPQTLGDGLRITLLGRFVGIDRPDTPVFQLWVRPDGSLWWWDGLPQNGFPANAESLGWTELGRAGTVPLGEWSTVTVQTPQDHRQSQVYVSPLGDSAPGGLSAPGGFSVPDAAAHVGPIGPVGITPVAAVSGFELATIDVPARNAAAVDVVAVDDITLTDGRRAARAPRQPEFLLGQRTLIDSTDEGLMQFPNSSTTREVPGGGREVLVTYPVHGDATHDTGTAMAASTDDGRTWTDVSERNPFSDEQSFYLTALANGDLLAVNYHTFMVEGSGERQALVPTAVSSDGGRTWEHREGTMTAPEAMRPVSPGTSRPGSRLGGFVLVHSVTEADDGTLFQTGYGYYAGDQRFRSVLLASTDGGVTWTLRSTMAVDDDLSDHPRYEGFGEATVEFTRDGAMIAVMRTGNYQPLHQVRSTDQGRTWSAPQIVRSGPDRTPVVGVFPDLELMGNGVLVLWAGRPGQFLMSSADGTGRTWSERVWVDYANSGNGTVTPIGDSRLLTFGDRGADWTPNTNPRKEIWAAPVTVRPIRR